MKYKATVSFAGVISMRKGQEAELSKGAALSSLIKCGYVTAAEETAEAVNLEKTTEVKTDGAKRGNSRRRKAGNAD